MTLPAAKPHPAEGCRDGPDGARHPLCHGRAASPWGTCEVVWSGPWLLRFEFVDPEDPAALPPGWPEPCIRRDDGMATEWVEAVCEDRCPLHPHAAGTPFQTAVWQALRSVPRGHTVSYAQLAVKIGCPGAARAVGRAVGANPIAIAIPCHRVVRADGGAGGYRWGTWRKLALLAWEQSRG